MNRLEEHFLNTLAKSAKKSLEEIQTLHQQAQVKDRSLLEVGQKAKAFDEIQYQKALAKSLDLTYLKELPELEAEKQTLFTSSIPIRIAKQFLFYPVKLDRELTLAVTQPWPSQYFEEAAQALGFSRFKLAVATEEQILDAINRSFDRIGAGAEEAAEVLEEDADFNDLEDLEEMEDLLDAQDEEPIKKLMNSILFQSVKAGSSDVHIDPTQKNTLVRNRIDGVLRQVAQVPRQAHIPLVNRVKVMAGLDISTKNQPQDGRSMVLLGGKKIDIRVSTIPTVHGERAVLRLLNQSQGILDLTHIGLLPVMKEQIQKEVTRPHGILLVTGPTGSGKTTTLYSCLALLNAHEKNIVTIEDPVEYRISEYGQMQVNEKIGVTFAKGLRSMLRQDPDVIMVGEMRDGETAQIAIQAALTGHLVLSTLHTNDAPASIIRLIDMGIEPFLVSSTLSSILAQRLVRKICNECKSSYTLSKEELKALNLPEKIKKTLSGKLHRGKGCKNCMGTGYQGRVGVFELLIMHDEVRSAVASMADASKIRELALKHGMMPLIDDAAQKVAQGDTSLEEMLRIVHSEQNQTI